MLGPPVDRLSLPVEIEIEPDVLLVKFAAADAPRRLRKRRKPLGGVRPRGNHEKDNKCGQSTSVHNR
jgi:hypothetical protein